MRYEVDAAMMGQDWSDADDLGRFCQFLQAELDHAKVRDIEVRPHTGSYNGAENEPEATAAVTGDIWNQALAHYYAPIRSKRKPHNHLAGYKCSRKNKINGHRVVIYDAEEQGLDSDGAGRWAVVCEEHSTLTFVTSVASGRPLMKIPEFCEQCMEEFYKKEG